MVTRRARRWMIRGVSILAILLVSGVVVVTWIQAGTLERDFLSVGTSPEGPTVVRSIEPGVIVLDATARTDRPGTWGLVFDGGRAVVGPVVAKGDGVVERRLESVTGALVPGTEVTFDRAVWGLEDATALGFTTGFASGPTGALAVWTLPGDDDTWAVILHDRGGDPSEAFRVARAASAAGYPAVVGSYRTDPPQSAGTRHGYGYDEWEDAAAHLDFALARGARDVVVVGLGSGASVAAVHLAEAREVERIVGVVLDAPVLDLGAIVADDWASRGVPTWLVSWTQALSAVRFGVDFGALDHLDQAWEIPVLILHGRDDLAHPLEASRDLAVAHPESVLLITFPAAGTGESWNTDPPRYESVLAGFLDDVGAGASRFEPVAP